MPGIQLAVSPMPLSLHCRIVVDFQGRLQLHQRPKCQLALSQVHQPGARGRSRAGGPSGNACLCAKLGPLTLYKTAPSNADMGWIHHLERALPAVAIVCGIPLTPASMTSRLLARTRFRGKPNPPQPTRVERSHLLPQGEVLSADGDPRGPAVACRGMGLFSRREPGLRDSARIPTGCSCT